MCDKQCGSKTLDFHQPIHQPIHHPIHPSIQPTHEVVGQTDRQLEWAAIALGSNLGDSATLLQLALKALNQTDGIALAHVSPFYCTAPVGPPQPDYVNACAILQTALAPLPLLDRLLQVEQQFGRVRRERWGPRLLDLDLLLYGDRQIDHARLQVPHPRMRDRAFVLVPLADIAADWVDPTTGKTVAALLAAVDPVGVDPLDLS